MSKVRNEDAIKRRAEYLLRKKLKSEEFRYPTGQVDCSRLADKIAEMLGIDANDTHWIYELTIRIAYEKP
jgi:hypothetical protein